MRESYSVSLIQFTLTHWWDIESGQLTTEQMAEFTRSVGKHNPRETAFIWKADISRALSCLCKPYDHDYWPDICRDLSAEGARVTAEQLSPAQRYVVRNCIFGECGSVCQKLKRERRQPCREIGAIMQMKRFLNGEPEPEDTSSLPGANQQRKAWHRKSRKVNNLKQYNNAGA